MIVLGIDPGSIVTGYGLVNYENGILSHIDNGGINTNSKDNFPSKLKSIYDELWKIIENNSPDVAAIEDIFYAQNVKIALKLGHTRGIALLCARNAGIDIFEYTPLEIKKAIVGYGRAHKSQIQKMVGIILNVQSISSLDASDALAVAICHIHSMKIKRAASG